MNISSSGSSTGNSYSRPGSDDARNDLYTPKVSTWGLFERPRDISKAYGGGRVIDPIKLEEERRIEEQERLAKNRAGPGGQQQQYLVPSMAKEKAHEAEIREALGRARGFFSMGNAQAAVEKLEGVRALVSWQSDLGGEVLLELAMTLEAVGKAEDSRKIYGQLITKSWSSKTRRSALGLIQGLNIAQQIRNVTADVGVMKPVLDPEGMARISQTLEAGLRSTRYESRRGRNRYSKGRYVPGLTKALAALVVMMRIMRVWSP